MLKIFRSYQAAFEADAERADSVYSEDELKRIAAAGFNAVWIRGIFAMGLERGPATGGGRAGRETRVPCPPPPRVPRGKRGVSG